MIKNASLFIDLGVGVLATVFIGLNIGIALAIRLGYNESNRKIENECRTNHDYS